MPAKLLQSCPALCNPMNCSPQAPLSMGFSRQEYWSGLPCPLPGDLLHPRIEPKSHVAPALWADSLPLVPPGKPQSNYTPIEINTEKAMAPTPVLLPGKSHGWRSLLCCSP